MFHQRSGRLIISRNMGLFNKKEETTAAPKPKTVKIAGKEVHLHYSIGTEITFYDLAGIEFKDFIQEAAVKKTSNPKNVIYAILAAALAYSESRGEEPQITDKELLFQATNEELTEALVEITKMFAEWYKLPLGEEPKGEKGTKGKN
jgi:hypothetical protein